MKTAIEILEENNRLDVYLHDYDCFDDVILAMKDYGKQCAQQALNDAAKNAEIFIHSVSPEIDKSSIINTEIKTP